MKTSGKINWRTAAVAAAALCSAGAAHADHRRDGDYERYGHEHYREHYRVWRDHGHHYVDHYYAPRHYWYPEYRNYREYRPHYRAYYPRVYGENWFEPEYGAQFSLSIPLR